MINNSLSFFQSLIDNVEKIHKKYKCHPSKSLCDRLDVSDVMKEKILYFCNNLSRSSRISAFHLNIAWTKTKILDINSCYCSFLASLPSMLMSDDQESESDFEIDPGTITPPPESPMQREDSPTLQDILSTVSTVDGMNKPIFMWAKKDNIGTLMLT